VLQTASPLPVAFASGQQHFQRAGLGEVELSLVAGRTAVVTRRATSPLKLLTPRGFANGAARIVASTYGGGLLGGDDVRLSVTVGPGATGVLTTQASTKVYRSGRDGLTSRQRVDVSVADDGLFVSAPDPVVCFAGARYEQVQTFDLSSGGSLLAIDWLTSGRVARGERWAFVRYRSETSIRVDGRLVARDALLLDPADGPVGAPHRLGRFDCVAVAFLVGPAMRGAASEMLDRMKRMPLSRRASLIGSAGPLAGDGAILRVIGPGTEAVGQTLRSVLMVAFGAAGGDPWDRKW
jgi:urease accessory protein